MFHKPCLCVTCPETHHCLSHYASNSHANLGNLFISWCPEGYFVILTPIYNIVPLRNCPLNSQSQSRGMEIHFYLHSVVHGKNMKLSKRSDLFILKYTFRKWPFLNNHCLLVVNNCSLHYRESFLNLKCLVCWLLPRWNIGLVIRFDIEPETVWPLIFIFNSSHYFLKRILSLLFCKCMHHRK